MQLLVPEFDTATLTAKPDFRTASEFENVAAVKFDRRPSPVVRTVGSVIIDTVAFFLWILLCIATILWPFTFETENRVFDEPIEKFGLGLILVIPVTVVYFPIAALVIWAIQRGESASFPRYRLSQFAAANGMTYTPKILLSDGSKVLDVITGGEPVRIEIGNLHLPIPATKTGATAFAYGYAAVQLPSALPHIVLDAVRNDVVFLYSARELSTTNPEDWALVSRAIGAVLPQFTSWERWRETVSDESITPLPAPTELRLTSAAPLLTSAEPTVVEAKTRGEGADAISSDLLIDRRTDDLVTTPMKRRAPLWIRFLQVAVIGYGLALLSLIFRLD